MFSGKPKILINAVISFEIGMFQERKIKKSLGITVFFEPFHSGKHGKDGKHRLDH
jgi:hypothetical protein